MKLNSFVYIDLANVERQTPLHSMMARKKSGVIIKPDTMSSMYVFISKRQHTISIYWDSCGNWYFHFMELIMNVIIPIILIFVRAVVLDVCKQRSIRMHRSCPFSWSVWTNCVRNFRTGHLIDISEINIHFHNTYAAPISSA